MIFDKPSSLHSTFQPNLVLKLNKDRVGFVRKILLKDKPVPTALGPRANLQTMNSLFPFNT